MNEHTIKPENFSFHKTEDPWVFEKQHPKYPEDIIRLEKLTTMDWVITILNRETEKPVVSLYRGKIPTSIFAVLLFENIGINV